MAKNIVYHTRLYTDNSQKIVGGSFGGEVNQDTVERLVKSHFKVVIKNSGAACFIDSNGREVSLYISVDPLKTEIGKLASAAKFKEDSIRLQKEKDIQDKLDIQLENIMESMTTEEVIAKLLS